MTPEQIAHHVMHMEKQGEIDRTEINRLRALVAKLLRELQKTFRDPYPKGEDL